MARIGGRWGVIWFSAWARVSTLQPLGRMKMRVLLREYHPEIQSIEFDGADERWERCFVRGPEPMPIRSTIH